MSTYSDFAVEKLLDLYKDHSHEVGIQMKKLFPSKYKDYDSTDCITYALNVISYAFDKSGNTKTAKHVWSLGERGADLAKYLVSIHAWKGVYLNPDAKHPQDGASEHTYSSYLVDKTCKYYQIPMSYRVDNYNPTSKSHPSFKKVNRKAGVTILNKVDIESLEKVKFGFGISRGGKHTWLFSEGLVYEVHWDKVGIELYEASSLRTYPWLSGALVIPDDQASYLSNVSKVKCGT